LRLTVEIRIDGAGEISAMADWIDKLKENELAREAGQREQNQIRLHNIEVIKAKAPAVWQSLKNAVQADSEKLRREFPDNSEYHCTFEQPGPNHFALVRDSLEQARRVDLKFNLEGHFIEMVESFCRERAGKYENIDESQIKISVNQADNLELRIGNAIQSVPSLSERLCRTLFKEIF